MGHDTTQLAGSEHLDSNGNARHAGPARPTGGVVAGDGWGEADDAGLGCELVR
jgi:hypothetical protein